MPRPQVAVQSKKVQHDIKPSNPFSALAESDSEEEQKETQPQTQENQTTTPQASPTFRTWNVEGDEKRWNLDGKKNIFSSPFSKQKRHQARAYNPESKEGWTSIRLPEEVDVEGKTPPFGSSTPPASAQEVDTEELPKLELPPQEFPSLFTRGNAKGILLESTIPTPSISAPLSSKNRGDESLVDSLENVSALMWAERIKRSLERAEQLRAEKARQPTASAEDLMRSVGRLSFFRRSLSTEEEDTVSSQ